MTEISNNSVPLARDQNDNGILSAVASNGTDGRHRLKKGDVRDGRIFLGGKSVAAGENMMHSGTRDATWEVGAVLYWERPTFGIARGNKKPALQIELAQSKNSPSVSFNFRQISLEDTKREMDGCTMDG